MARGADVLVPRSRSIGKRSEMVDNPVPVRATIEAAEIFRQKIGFVKKMAI